MVQTALALAPDELELARLGHLADRLLASGAFAHGGVRPQQRRAGRGLELLGLRDFQPGDDPRRLDWRASARAPRLQLREHMDERASAWLVLVDRSASMGVGGAAKWALAFRLAAACSYLLLRAGHRVGLAALSDEIDRVAPLGRGRHQYLRILHALGDTAPRGGGGGSTLARGAHALPERVGFAVVSDFLAPDAMASGLDALLAAGTAVQALQVLAADECRLAPTLEGGARVVDVESGEQRLVAGRGACEAAAGARLADLRDTLTRHCARRGIPFTSARSDEPWRDVLVRHLLRLERRRA